jgi:uncharacterized protein (TIGR02147 family)
MKKKVYDYLDYRDFLRDCYETLKKTDKKYSQRFFMQKLGVKSTGYFAEILSGKRQLNDQNTEDFCRILKLDRDESEYFTDLVKFNQARSNRERDHWLSKMMKCSKVNSMIINRDIYEYFSKWYYAAIRELLFFYKKIASSDDIAKMLCPQITSDEAFCALQLLEKLNLIERLEDGSFRQKNTVISTGERIRSVEITNYQLQTIELAKLALDKIPMEHREISTLTMSISAKAYSEIVDILGQVRRDIIKVTQQDSDEDRVYQLNVQLYPLTMINY